MGQIDLVNKKIDNLHYLELTKDGRPSLILEAESARFNQGKWLLTSGSQIQFVNEGSVSVKDSFNTRAYTLRESYEDLAAVHGRNTGADERSIFLIQELMDARKKTGGDYHFLETEFFWHLGYPFICFFVTYIGGNMGSRMRHGGVAVSIALAMVFTIFYFFLMYFGTAMGETGVLPPLLAANLANIVSLGFVGYIRFKVDW